MHSIEIKISIIMPVYNVKLYLEKAARSIIDQSFKDFELYLVDDGSTDGSSKLCDELSKTDNRIKVIHQNNAGAHNARNNALKLAKGKYVCFFDSDDYISSEMLKDLYDIAEKYDSKLVISGFYIETYYNEDKFINFDYIPVTTNNSEIQNFSNTLDFRTHAYLNFDKNMFYSPWNKLFRLDYLNNNNIKFPITYRDDFPFVIDVIKDIDNVTFTKTQYYHFLRKRSESETQKYVSNLYDKREEEHKMMVDLYKYWNIDDNNSNEMIARRYIDRIIECMVNLYNKQCKLTNTQKRKEIHKYLNSENFNSCIKIAKPKKLYLKIIYLILKSKVIVLNATMARFINFVKKSNIKLFSYLKITR